MLEKMNTAAYEGRKVLEGRKTLYTSYMYEKWSKKLLNYSTCEIQMLNTLDLCHRIFGPFRSLHK